MSETPAENPIPGTVAFTRRGAAALDDRAAELTADCDGSSASIAKVLDRVLGAEVDELAAKLGPPSRLAAGQTSHELGPAPEQPDSAARRRLDHHRAARSASDGLGPDVRR